jgi:hypothetical protein
MDTERLDAIMRALTADATIFTSLGVDDDDICVLAQIGIQFDRAGGDRVKLYERLNDQLGEAEERLAEARDRIDELENARHWTGHTSLDVDPHGLPVPRLQMSMHEGHFGHYEFECRYDLVYEHLLGEIVLVPLGSTRIGGGGKLQGDYIGIDGKRSQFIGRDKLTPVE